jgi:hypothetical protein
MNRDGRRRRIATGLLCLIGLAGAGLVTYRMLLYSFFHVGSRFNPASLQSSSPTFFYLDWAGDLPDSAAVQAALAPDGIIRSDKDIVWENTLRHDPLTVIQGSIGIHDQLLQGGRPELDLILRRQLEWLVHDGMTLLPDSVPVWPQYYRFDRYGLHDRWISALTQGQAISILVRGAAYTGRREYLDWARRAVRAFTGSDLPIVWRGDDGTVFFEEYPCTPPSHVLNGCLFAWLGLWDYVRATGDPEVRAFCVKTLADISATVPRYETVGWTRYDVHQRRPTSPGYQGIHAALAETLAGLFPEDPPWQDRARRWRRAADNPWLRIRVFFLVAWDKGRAKITRDWVRAEGRLLTGSMVGDGGGRSGTTTLPLTGAGAVPAYV